MEEEKGLRDIAAIAVVELRNAFYSLTDELLLAQQFFLGRVGKIGQQGKAQVGVRVGQVMIFNLTQQGSQFIRAFEQRRDNNNCPAFRWNSFLKIEFGEDSRRDEVYHQRVDHIHGNSGGRKNGEQCSNNGLRATGSHDDAKDDGS